MKNFLFVGLIYLSLAACNTPPVQYTSTFTVSPAITATDSVPETATATSVTTMNAPLPPQFSSNQLRAGIEPVPYIENGCEYLVKRWDPAGSLPGTVVAPIMFHSILKGSNTNDDPSAINFVQFQEIIRQAESLDFKTITTHQLLAFLQENAKIPPRSMILILDDRRPGTAEDYFLPVNEELGWTTTLAWIAEADTESRPGKRAGENLWDWIERVNDTGYFDIQSHGKDHIYLNEDMSEETVRAEIEGSIPFLKLHFGITPIAYIWPGGNYTGLGIQIAHEAGFEIGFTVHSRGPVQFNWIPQGEEERAFDDPLMLLPRYWDTAAILNLEQTAVIGDAAQAFAKESYISEAEWYAQNCGGELPPLEEIFK